MASYTAVVQDRPLVNAKQPTEPDGKKKQEVQKPESKSDSNNKNDKSILEARTRATGMTAR